jgi:intergrase/recombinase
MKALSSLAKFLGLHEEFLQLRRRYNLTWTTGRERIDALSLFFDDSQTIDKMLSWVHEAINTLPTDDMRAAIKWNCLTGLRPNESLASLRLIKDPEQFKTYYDPDRQLLCHYKFPKIFFRRTKVAYVSVLNNELLRIGQNIRKIPSYVALQYASTRRSLNFHMAYCRKIFNSWLRQSGVQAEIVDMLSGRVGQSVFLRHYYRPSLDYRQTVLQALEKLQRAITY